MLLLWVEDEYGIAANRADIPDDTLVKDPFEEVPVNGTQGKDVWLLSENVAIYTLSDVRRPNSIVRKIEITTIQIPDDDLQFLQVIFSLFAISFLHDL